MNNPFSELRKKAETAVSSNNIDVSNLTEDKIKSLIHNLEVHQVELELQNDELQSAIREKDRVRQRYFELFEFAPVGYISIDQEFRIIHSNQSFAKMLDTAKDGILQTPFTNYIDPKFQDTFFLAVGHLNRTGEKQTFEIQLKHHDKCDICVHAEMISQDNGQTFFISLSDITERKSAEQAVQQSEIRFKNLFDAVADPLFIVDLQGHIVEVNKKACSRLGYSREKLLEMSVADIDADHLPDDIAKVFGELMAKGSMLHESTHKTSEGKMFPVEIHSRVIEFNDKPAFLSLARDISRRREAENRYAFLSSMSFEGIFMHRNGIAIDVNDACARITGFSKDELVGKNLFELIPDDGDIEKIRKNMEKKNAPPINVKVKRKDGRIFSAEIHARSAEYNGEPIRIVAVHDISQRLKMETALKENRENLANILENMHDAVYSMDAVTFKLLQTNPAIEKIFGRPMADFYKYPMLYLEMVHPDDYAFVQQSTSDIFTRKQGEWIYRIIRPDGDIRWVSDQARLVEDHAGRPLRIDCFFSDITDKKRAELDLKERISELKELYLKQKNVEQELRESEEKFRSIVENVNDIIYAVTPDGIFTYISPNWINMLGHDPEYVIGKHFADFVHPDDVHLCTDFLFKVLTTGEKQSGVEYRVAHLDGTWRWHFSNGSPIKNNEGQAVSYIGIARDITERRKNEQALKRAEEQARAASRAKSEFLANMSHEIRTPLNGVIGFTELLVKTRLTPEQKQYVKNAHTSARSLLGIINDILDFSKIEAGKMELDEIKTDLIELLEQTADIVKYSAAEKGIELILSISPAAPRYIVADPIRLRQVLVNFLSNAVKFTQKGEIELSLKYNPVGDTGTGSFTFSVRDTGIGISEDSRKRLFKAFDQTDTSITRKFGGTGLGLVISDMLLKKMNSSVNLETVPGKGSTFSFTLIRAFEHDDKPDYCNTGQMLIIDDNRNSNNGQISFKKGYAPTILVAEDVEMNMLLIKELTLKIIPDALIIEAVSGDMAVEQFKKQSPDLIFMDIQMPKMDGYAATREIRNIEKHNIEQRPTPILALTAAAIVGEKEKCLNAGMDDYLTKPIDPDYLENLLYKYLINPDCYIQDELDAEQSETREARVFNKKDLITRMMGDEDLARQVTHWFLTDIPEQILILKDLLKSGDMSKSERQAHKIKGAAVHAGAEKLGLLALELENDTKSGNLKAAIDLFSEITECLHKTTSEIKAQMS